MIPLDDPFDLEPATSLSLTMPSGSHARSQVLDTPRTWQVLREVNERRQRRQPAGAMDTIAVVHALLEAASLLAHRRCLIDSPVRSHARLRRQHSGDLPMIAPMDRVRGCRSGWFYPRSGWRPYPRVLRELRTDWCGACDGSVFVRHAIAARIARFAQRTRIAARK